MSPSRSAETAPLAAVLRPARALGAADPKLQDDMLKLARQIFK